jgi:hypothetical protein
MSETPTDHGHEDELTGYIPDDELEIVDDDPVDPIETDVAHPGRVDERASDADDWTDDKLAPEDFEEAVESELPDIG